MGHDDAARSDDKRCVRQPVDEGVKAHEDLFSQARMDQLGPVGRHVVALQMRVDDEAVLLGVGPLAEARIFDECPLADQDIGTDPRLGLNDRIAAEGGGFRHGADRRQMDDVEHPSKIFLAGVKKFHESSCGRPIGLNTNVFRKRFGGKAVPEIEGALLVDPYLSGFNPVVPELPGLHIGEGADDAAVKGRQIHGGKCAEKAAFERGAVDVGKGAGGGIFHQEYFRVFGIVRAVVHQGLNEQAIGD